MCPCGTASTEAHSAKAHKEGAVVLATWAGGTASVEPRDWMPSGQRGKAVIPEEQRAVDSQYGPSLIKRLCFYLKPFLLSVFCVWMDPVENSTKDLRKKERNPFSMTAVELSLSLPSQEILIKTLKGKSFALR